MTGLNENHKRRILTSLQYADKMLEDSLHALAPGARPLFSGYIQDLSPAASRRVGSYAAKIREQMSRLLHKCGIEPPAPGTYASWKLRTCITSLDLTLEDIYPEKLRGYGKMDVSAARDLTWTLQEIRRLVSRLLADISGPEHAQPTDDLLCLKTAPALSALIDRIAAIISHHGLVEFLPALDALLRKVRSHRYEIAVFGKINSGKSSLINRLLQIGSLPVGVTPMTAVPVRVVGGPEPHLRVSFADHVEDVPTARLAEFASAQQNPANLKRVVALELAVPSVRLQEGFAFVDTPGAGALAAGAAKFLEACLPDSDLGLVLVDGQASLSREDLELLRSLEAAGIPSVVLIAKCDLIPQSDLGRVIAYSRRALTEHLGFCPEIVPVSSAESWASQVDAWFEQTISPLRRRSHTALIDATARKTQALGASLLATLEMQAAHAPAGLGLRQESERILRRLDESVAAFQQHWEDEFEGMSGWSEVILEAVAAALARAATGSEAPAGMPPDLLAETVTRAIGARAEPFLQGYQELTSRIKAGIDELRGGECSGSLVVQELPQLSSLPAPLSSPLAGVVIAPPGPMARTNPAARSRYFRRELEEKIGKHLQLILDELHTRFGYWFLASMNALHEGLRLQTDPVRYRSQSQVGAEADGVLAADIEFLRRQTQ
jgi:GTP-binding protein EngB required for normal cell division